MNFLFAVIAFVLCCAIDVGVARAYNTDDPKMAADNERLTNDSMNAQFLSRGIPCDTGACFQNTDPGIGFNTTPLLNPDGTPFSPAPRVAPGESVR